MMGERTVAQEALFYGFSISGTSRRAIFCGLLTASSICLDFGLTCALSTAKSGDPRLIQT